MGWILFWTLVGLFVAGGIFVRVNDLRFRKKVAQGVAELRGGPVAHVQIDLQRIAELPSPVRRYLDKALEAREYVIRSVHFRHAGTFRPKLDGRWFPIRGREYVVTEPLGFVWWGRLRLIPGLWIDAIDRSVRGSGSLYVALVSTFVIVDTKGPALDRGELLRVLSEMPLYPTAMLDPRYVEWEPIDERHARATLRLGSQGVTGIFEFSEDDMPASFSANRERELGAGKSEMTRWSGRFGEYRMTAGVRVPHRLEASWEVDGQWMPYARFEIDHLEFDPLDSDIDFRRERAYGAQPGFPSTRAANKMGV